MICLIPYLHIYTFSIPLMKDIVSSPFLYVMQVEIDIYTLLKKVGVSFLILMVDNNQRIFSSRELFFFMRLHQENMSV